MRLPPDIEPAIGIALLPCHRRRNRPHLGRPRQILATRTTMATVATMVTIATRTMMLKSTGATARGGGQGAGGTTQTVAKRLSRRPSCLTRTRRFCIMQSTHRSLSWCRGCACQEQDCSPPVQRHAAHATCTGLPAQQHARDKGSHASAHTVARLAYVRSVATWRPLFLPATVKAGPSHICAAARPACARPGRCVASLNAAGLQCGWPSGGAAEIRQPERGRPA